MVEDLSEKAINAKKKAFEEEIKRIEGEISALAKSEIQKIASEETQILEEALQNASQEHKSALESHQKRKAEILKKLEPEKKKKIDARKRAEEERKKKEEQERKRLEAEEKLRKEEEAKRRKIEREEKIRESVEHIRSLFQSGDLDAALAATEEALTLEASNNELKTWDQRIKDAQHKKVREEEAAIEREKQKAEVERKKKSKKAVMIASIIIGIVLIVIIYQLQKEIFPPSVNIAILPLTSTNKSTIDEGVCSSLSREIGERIAPFKQITVLGQTTTEGLVERLRSPDKTINKLGYPFILKGTVSNTGGTYSIDIHVVDSTGEEIWSRKFESPQSKFAELPSEIAVELARTMGVSITDEVEKTIRRTGTTNFQSYLLFLKGISALHKRTPASAAEAYSLFSEASASDPVFADASAGAALALLLQNELNRSRSDTALRLADQYLQKASRGKSVLAQIGQGKYYLVRGRLNDALKTFEEILAKSSQRTEALTGKATVQIYTGRYDDAIANLMNAYNVNPRSPEVLQILGYALELRGKLHDILKYQDFATQFSADSTQYLISTFADAVIADPDLQVGSGSRIVAACGKLLENNPRDYKLLYRQAQVLQVLGKIPEANPPLLRIRAILQDQLIRNPFDAEAMVYLGLALTRLGQFPEAVNILQKAASAGKSNPFVMYKVAEAYSLQISSYRGSKIDAGKKGLALKYLRDAISLEYRLDELTNGDFYNLRTQPEFLQTIQLSLK